MMKMFSPKGMVIRAYQIIMLNDFLLDVIVGHFFTPPLHYSNPRSRRFLFDPASRWSQTHSCRILARGSVKSYHTCRRDGRVAADCTAQCGHNGGSSGKDSEAAGSLPYKALVHPGRCGMRWCISLFSRRLRSQ